MSAATLKPIRLECYLPRLSGANKASSFRTDSLVRRLLQCKFGFECHWSVAICMDTHVGLNVATRVCDVCPDKCWFAVLCRFWLQCRRNLRLQMHSQNMQHMQLYNCNNGSTKAPLFHAVSTLPVQFWFLYKSWSYSPNCLAARHQVKDSNAWHVK